MKKLLKFYFFLKFVLISFHAFSYQDINVLNAEVTGRAVILDNNIEKARRLALEDALYLASLKGGAFVDGFSSVSKNTIINDQSIIKSDSKILDFDTNYKVYPPLRTKDDIEELFNGLNDGTIDVISSFHQPQDIDSKNCEFDKASFGIISIQTFYSNILEISRYISEDILIEVTPSGISISGCKI